LHSFCAFIQETIVKKLNMKYIVIPRADGELLPWYLAAEEYAARHLKEEACFFMWQVEPTVIFGRNQLIENEVNMDFCKQHHIHTFRRKSGGGCVYADRRNIMFSHICAGDNVQFNFDNYVRKVAFVLRKLGIPATASGRNDILIEGRKVSGNAFYHVPGRSIVHGTMLYDTNMENMVGSITPSEPKLLSKGVESVRSHIALLKDYTDMDINGFKRFVRNNLCDGEITLPDSAEKIIETIMQEYLSDDFIYGHNPRYSIVRRKRIEGCGDLEARLELKNGIVRNANLLGDFFPCGDLDNGLLKHLKNIPFRPEDIRAALSEIHMENFILNLGNEDFIQLLFNDAPQNTNIG